MVTIATGQVAGTSKDGKQLPPHVRVWDSVSLNTLHVVGMGVFDRAVTCVGFSKSNGGIHLCAVDDANDHIMSVWEWQKEKKLAEVKDAMVLVAHNYDLFKVENRDKEREEIARKAAKMADECSNDSVLSANFHPMDSNLILTCGKSHLNFWTVEDNTLTKRQGLFDKHEKPKYVLCIAFAENGDTITGDSSGNMCIWGKGLYAPGDTRFHSTALPVFQGHVDELWGLDSHPSMERFVTCGHDKVVHLWDVATHKPLWTKVIEGHSSFVTHLDWSKDSKYIVSNSGDYEILYWNSSNCKQVTNADTVRNLEWASSTCVLGIRER
ncbi:UNVERIFIED_CONTAM: hypothetical protein FKN15_078528 [Acipenser sinensis]